MSDKSERKKQKLLSLNRLNKYPNVKLLSTSIMMASGYYGDARCVPQSVITHKVLTLMGITSTVVVGHAVVSDGEVGLPGVFFYSPSALWTHCWVEVDGSIIDTNCEVIESLQYSKLPVNDKDKLHDLMLSGKSRYERVGQAVELFTDDWFNSQKIDRYAVKSLEAYNMLTQMSLPALFTTEEGIICVHSDGAWSKSSLGEFYSPLDNPAPSDNICVNPILHYRLELIKSGKMTCI